MEGEAAAAAVQAVVPTSGQGEKIQVDDGNEGEEDDSVQAEVEQQHQPGLGDNIPVRVSQRGTSCSALL